MQNVLDYIRWRGDLSFAQDPLNAVDSVIFSNLVYIRYPEELVTEGKLTLGQVQQAIEQRADGAQLGHPHQLELLRAAAASRRFGGVRLAQFRNEFIPEEDTQFAALAKALELYTPGMAVCPPQHLHEGDKALFCVGGNHLPAIELVILPIGCKAVIIPAANQVVVPVVHGNLPGNLLLFLLAQLGDVQLIAKGSRQSHVSPGLEWGHPAHRVIGAIRHMGPHGG